MAQASYPVADNGVTQCHRGLGDDVFARKHLSVLMQNERLKAEMQTNIPVLKLVWIDRRNLCKRELMFLRAF